MCTSMLQLQCRKIHKQKFSCIIHGLQIERSNLSAVYFWLSQEIQSHLQEECERLKGDVVAHKCTIEGKVEELQKCKVIVTALPFSQHI